MFGPRHDAAHRYLSKRSAVGFLVQQLDTPGCLRHSHADPVENEEPHSPVKATECMLSAEAHPPQSRPQRRRDRPPLAPRSANGRLAESARRIYFA